MACSWCKLSPCLLIKVTLSETHLSLLIQKTVVMSFLENLSSVLVVGVFHPAEHIIKYLALFFFLCTFKSAGGIPPHQSLLYSLPHSGIHKVARWTPLLAIQRPGQEQSFHRSRVQRDLWDHREPCCWNPQAPLNKQWVGEVGKTGHSATAAAYETLCLVSVWGKAPWLRPESCGKLPPSEWCCVVASELDGGHKPPWHHCLLRHDGQLPLFFGGHHLQQCRVSWDQADQSLGAGPFLGVSVSAEQQTLNKRDNFKKQMRSN